MNVYVPKNEPLCNGANTIPLAVTFSATTFSSTYKPPQILAEAFTTNPLSGEIDAVNEPLFNMNVSNDKFEILMFVRPLPSP